MKIIDVLGPVTLGVVLAGSIVGALMMYKPKVTAASLHANCSRVWDFQPQADITAYDLARIMSHVRPGMGSGLRIICEKPGDVFPEKLRRHFVEVRP